CSCRGRSPGTSWPACSARRSCRFPTTACPRTSSWRACGCACRGPATPASSAMRSTCTTRRPTGPGCGTPCSRPGGPLGRRGPAPCHIRRIEGGILAFGADIWYDTNPFEVDMGYPWMVDLGQEADFVGKRALQRIKAEGPRRKLVGIEIDGPAAGSYIDNEMI